MRVIMHYSTTFSEEKLADCGGACSQHVLPVLTSLLNTQSNRQRIRDACTSVLFFSFWSKIGKCHVSPSGFSCIYCGSLIDWVCIVHHYSWDLIWLFRVCVLFSLVQFFCFWLKIGKRNVSPSGFSWIFYSCLIGSSRKDYNCCRSCYSIFSFRMGAVP